jgi:periplasmic protein TonB
LIWRVKLRLALPRRHGLTLASCDAVTSSSDDVAAAGDEAAFYLAKDDQTFGPHTVPEIQSFLETGVIVPENLLWTEGMTEWMPISQLFHVPTRVEELPPPAIAPDAPAMSGVEVQPNWSGGEGTFLEPWQIIHASPDGLSRRLSAAVITAILLHVVLLVTLTLVASTFFKINDDVAVTPAPEAPPMDVALVEESDPPPPEPPPPPPDDPPPPPALPEIPIPTVMLPPTPVPLTPPEPTPLIMPPAPLPQAVVAAPKPVKIHRAPPASRPQAAPAADASPSDYLVAPPPSYPYNARQQHQEGTVILVVLINDAGEPVSVSIGQSSGFPLLDATAQHQVADHFRFKVGNARVLRVPIDFHL